MACFLWLICVAMLIALGFFNLTGNPEPEDGYPEGWGKQRAAFLAYMVAFVLVECGRLVTQG